MRTKIALFLCVVSVMALCVACDEAPVSVSIKPVATPLYMAQRNLVKVTQGASCATGEAVDFFEIPGSGGISVSEYSGRLSSFGLEYQINYPDRTHAIFHIKNTAEKVHSFTISYDGKTYCVAFKELKEIN